MTTEIRPGTTTTAAGRPSSGWLIGPLVGIVAFLAMMVTGAGFSVTDDIPVPLMLEKLDDAKSALLVGGGVQGLVALGFVLFGAYVRRSLLRREPDGALTPVVAFGGALLAASMTGMAAAHTQLASDLSDAVDPAIPLTLHTLEESLFAGGFCALALVAGAIAVAGLRRGSVARWFAGVSAFIAVLLVVAQLVVPWAGWFPAVVWMVVSAFGLRDRAA